MTTDPTPPPAPHPNPTAPPAPEASTPPAAPAAHALSWTTLGTAAGPTPRAARSQPANLLHRPGHALLVDAGEGAVDRLAGAGVALADVRVIVLSHLHIDHTGGLFALLGRRLQPRTGGPLAVYGPPGTAELVDRLKAALGHLADLGRASVPPGLTQGPDPLASVTATEVTEGSTFSVVGVRVTAAVNTHYDFPPGSDHSARFQSLSYRFDTPDRSIAYTGDTGPSERVEQLASGADLLVSEVNDASRVPPALHAAGPAAAAFMKRHFEREHLTPDAVGLLARRAGVRALVLTHIGVADPAIPDARRAIAAHFKGPVHFARDLDTF
ncbi:MBL fold metallo-hydrolase [Streptomyces sp. NPDC050560]|uniref:MBL fold metallo-hydrolase n=1 Tax=Streptomyces sp. NPDC050560 TaxID=3365630 RepID=UPI0037A8945D